MLKKKTPPTGIGSKPTPPAKKVTPAAEPKKAQTDQVTKPPTKPAPAPKPPAPKKEEKEESVIKEVAKVEPPKVEPPKPAPKSTKKKEEAKNVPQEPTKLDLMIEERLKGVKGNEAKIKRSQEQIEALRNGINDILRDVIRLKKIRGMVRLLNQPYQWYMLKREASSHFSTAWGEEYQYKTATMEFVINLKESTSARKYKYMVIVSGKSVTPGISETEIGSTNYSYIQDKYMDCRFVAETKSVQCFLSAEKGNEDLNKAYATEAEARQMVDYWKDKLVQDHMEIISEELELFESCKCQ